MMKVFSLKDFKIKKNSIKSDKLCLEEFEHDGKFKRSTKLFIEEIKLIRKV